MSVDLRLANLSQNVLCRSWNRNIKPGVGGRGRVGTGNGGDRVGRAMLAGGGGRRRRVMLHRVAGASRGQRRREGGLFLVEVIQSRVPEHVF